MTMDKQLARSIERMNQLVERVEKVADPVMQGEMQELVQCLLDYHSAAVRRLVQLIQERGEGSIDR